MAEGLLRRALQRRLVQLPVSSVGIGALEGQAAAPEAVALLVKFGIDISQHRGRQIRSLDVRTARLLLAMDSSHMDYIGDRWPDAMSRTRLLGHHGNYEIPDPYRQSEAVWEESLNLIRSGVGDWLAYLLANRR